MEPDFATPSLLRSLLRFVVEVVEDGDEKIFGLTDLVFVQALCHDLVQFPGDTLRDRKEGPALLGKPQMHDARVGAGALLFDVAQVDELGDEGGGGGFGAAGEAREFHNRGGLLTGEDVKDVAVARKQIAVALALERIENEVRRGFREARKGMRVVSVMNRC